LYISPVNTGSSVQLPVFCFQEMIEWHRPQVKALTDAGVDILAFETVPAQKEAEALVQLLSEFPSSKAWISFSCKVGWNSVYT
jgi:homocysteine S-methyltransferase